MKLLLVLLFISAFVLGVSHFLVVEYSLHWLYPWLDIPLHILGGVVIAFAFLTFQHIFHFLPDRYFSLPAVLAVVICGGLIWEIIEIQVGIPLIEDDFEIDLVFDVLMDILGGTIGYFVGTRIKYLE